MRFSFLDSFDNKVIVAWAIVAIIVSTAVLSILSVERTSVIEDTLVQSNISLVEENIEQIEQSIIDNDRALYEMVDVDNPDSWGEVIERIKSEDFNIDQVWIVDPETCEIVYPPWQEDLRQFYYPFRRSFHCRELELSRLQPGETNHLHKDWQDDYFFASYALKENRDGARLLLVFQTNPSKIIDLIDKYLRDLSGYHVSIVDFDNNAIYNEPVIRSGKYFHESRFPSTFYKWILQIAPRSFSEIESEIAGQRRLTLFLITLSMLLVASSVVVIYFAGRRERQLVRLKEDFISNVSHELKTPLSLIRMFSEILVSKKVRDDTARQEYYGIIHKESGRMDRLIANLLDFASLEQGRREDRFEMTNVSMLVSEGLSAYRHQIESQGFEVQCLLDPETPEILADSKALTMAFFNLLDNALKYSGGGKHITISVGRSDGHIELAVTDRGVGIAPGEQERIFEKFYRGNSAQVQLIRGSGIGLSITKHVAQMHRGRVLIESEPGKGSKFTLRIPLRLETAEIEH